jgi:hypothetical protein
MKPLAAKVNTCLFDNMNNVKTCVEVIQSRLISHAKSTARQRYVLCHPEEVQQGASSNPDTRHSGLRRVQLQHRVSNQPQH